MATYQLNQTKENGAPLTPIVFTIPDEGGTYKLTFVTYAGKTFTGEVLVDKTTTAINKSVSVIIGKTAFNDLKTGEEYYQGIATVSVGIGIMSDLSATALTLQSADVRSVGASYNGTTGTVTVIVTTYSWLSSVNVRVRGTLTTEKNHTYQIDRTLENGQVLSTTFEV